MTVARRRPRWLPDPEQGESTFVGDILRSETVGGSIALVGALVALVWANVDFTSYTHLREAHVGPLSLEHWAADGALAIFFFVAGLELKRELLVGSLRRPADALVPVVAACCGVAVPALIFLAANRGTDNLEGWAVPAATDIAFALAILAVVGSALPTPLRAFLLTLAVVDDLIVIVVIAVFYTSSIHLTGLLVAAVASTAYAVLQWRRVRSSFVYLPLAAVAWAGMYESGVHATIAGVVLGLLTRVLPDEDEVRSPAERLEHRLTPISAGVAVPFFALMSAGVQLTGGAALLKEPIVLGVVLGLVLGKPVGILGGAWLLTRFTRAELNEGMLWRDLFGVGIVAGVGFTVSLLVSELAFTGADQEQSKTAVLLASLIAGLAAALVLGRRNRRHREA
ncbi:MAG: Na+/H+ antiporter NhaA [Marmoricola sp.]